MISLDVDVGISNKESAERGLRNNIIYGPTLFILWDVCWYLHSVLYGTYEFNVGPETLVFFRQISCRNVP